MSGELRDGVAKALVELERRAAETERVVDKLIDAHAENRERVALVEHKTREAVTGLRRELNGLGRRFDRLGSRYWLAIGSSVTALSALTSVVVMIVINN